MAVFSGIDFTGLRLNNAQMCLFDSMPRSYGDPSFVGGISDQCLKFKYPPPHDCKIIKSGGDIIATFPFSFSPGFYGIRSTPASHWESTPELAMAVMWSLPFIISPPAPGSFALILKCQVTLYFHTPPQWWANSEFAQQRFTFFATGLDPAWRNDDGVAFFLAFNIPTLVNVPPWVQLFVDDVPLPFGSGAKERQVDKEKFYTGNPFFDLWAGPRRFTYQEFLTLPLTGFYQWRGFQFSNWVAFNFRLVVRRFATNFRVLWPREVFRAAKCMALVDPVSGLVAGPPIQLDRGEYYGVPK